MAHERGTRSIMVSPGPFPAINSPPDCWIVLFSSHLSHQKKRTPFGARERDSFNHSIAGALPGDQQSTGLLDYIILVPSFAPKKEDVFWRTREGLVQSWYRRGPTRRSTVHRTVGLYYSRPISHTKKRGCQKASSFLVREMGLEPTRRNHTHLKRACLPFQHSRKSLEYYNRTHSFCQPNISIRIDIVEINKET